MLDRSGSHRVFSETRQRRSGPGSGAVRAIAWLAAAFVVSRVAYAAAGIRFDMSPLSGFWQFLDPVLLRHDLLRSCFYLHSQPPLFNLFVGAMLQAFPGFESQALQFVYLLGSFVLCTSVLLLQMRLGVSRSVAFVVALLFMVSPSCVLYENLLFYTLPTALMLALSAVLLHEVIRRASTWSIACFLGCVLTLAMMRSVFHVLYVIVVVGGLAAVCRRGRKRIIILSLLPVLLLVGLSAKNLILFGGFESSSWMGMNLWGTTGRNLSADVRDRLVADGRLSEVSLVPRFSPLRSYSAEYTDIESFESVAALRDVTTSTGRNNFNHVAYVGISHQYLKDALYVVSHHPRALCVGVSRAWFQYFKSSSEDASLGANWCKLAAVGTLYDRLFYGKLPCDLSSVRGLPIYDRGRRHHVFAFLLLALPLLVLYALRLSRSHAGRGLDGGQRALIVYLCFNIVYVAVVGNLFEMGENNRFRFVTDPMHLVLLGLFVHRVVVPRVSALRACLRSP
jgi:hypothetical protein